MLSKKDFITKAESLLDKGTKSEKIVIEYFLSNFPISALGNLPSISKNCNISPATIQRTIIKLGFKKFPDFHDNMISILQDDQQSSPFLRKKLEQSNSKKHKYYFKNIVNIKETFRHTNFDDLEKASEILANPKSRIFCIGGRITGNLTSLFARYLKTVRLNVHESISYDNGIIDILINCNKNSVLLITDIRRYDIPLLQLAKNAKEEKGATIILLTDIWNSPVKEFADITIPVYTGTDASWDSNVALLTMLEELMGSTTNLLGNNATQSLKERERFISMKSL